MKSRKSPVTVEMRILPQFSPNPFEIRDWCNGPNTNCKAQFRQNRPYHIIQPHSLILPDLCKYLVVPTQHARNPEEWFESFEYWMNNAEIIKSDKQLESAENGNRGYFLTHGWIHPTRRNYSI